MSIINNIRRFFGMENKSRVGFKQYGNSTVYVYQDSDFALNCFKNKIWYRGKGTELEQYYSQTCDIDNVNFWSARPSNGHQMLKVHDPLPSDMVNALTRITVSDLQRIDNEDETFQDVWNETAKRNNFTNLLEEAVKDTLVLGDGAFKVSIDSDFDDLPIIEWFPADRVEYKKKRGRIEEIIFRTDYEEKGEIYSLFETYGYGYIKNNLFLGQNEVPLFVISETSGLSPSIFFGGYDEDENGKRKARGSYRLAVPCKFFSSSIYPGRGESIYESKIDAFLELDELRSQWGKDTRNSSLKTYIPMENLPIDQNGRVLRPNAFDNEYISVLSDGKPGAKNEITHTQPSMQSTNYEITYNSVLDEALRSIISPSTLGIDNKKLVDPAVSQREKEKTTMNTRTAIITVLSSVLSELAGNVVKICEELNGIGPELDSEFTVVFGQYANPSFEAMVPVLSQAIGSGLMSTETALRELYGENEKGDDWFKEEAQKIQEERSLQPIMEEPAVGSFLDDINNEEQN